jgi:hypothetical protein
VYLSLPVEFFAEGRRVREVIALAPATEAAGPELIVTTQNLEGNFELIHVRVAAEAWAAFAGEPVIPVMEAEFGVEGSMVSLTPTQLEAEILAETQSVLGLAIGPGPSLIAAVESGPRPGELMLFDLVKGDRRLLTDNGIQDYLPRMSGDGSYVAFVSLMKVSLSPSPFSVPRVLALTNQ